jgi:hypothetical protein
MNYTTFTYDIKKFNFVELMEKLFNVIDLTALHQFTQEKYIDQFAVGKDSSTVFHKTFYDKYRTGWPEMQSLYDEFVRIIMPYSEDILYQQFPTVRFHLPQNVAVGAFHNDAEFGHPEGEINFIIPLTNSNDTAAVWVESEPGKKDFKPMNMNVGEFIMFDGNHLTHGNKQNLTWKTRVSMDFRILPISKYDEANNSESITLKTKFKEGEYYKRLSIK